MAKFNHSLNLDANDILTSAIYDEDTGLWLHPSAMYHKGADGKPVATGEADPLPTKAEELEAKIDALNEKIDGIIDGNTPANVKAVGSILSLVDSPVTGVKTVTSTAAKMFAGSNQLAGRRTLMIRNLSAAVRIRVGRSSVTDETGFGVEPGAVLQLSIDPESNADVYAVSEAGNVDVEVLEA